MAELLKISREQWLTPPPGAGLPDYFVDLTAPGDFEPQYLLYFNNVGSIPRGDIQCLAGSSKEGKTTFARVLLAAMLSGDYCGFTTEGNKPLRVLVADTEQGACNVIGGGKELCRMVGKDPAELHGRNLWVMHLRRYSWREKRELFTREVERLKPDFVLLDGGVDLTKSANDEESVSELRDLLLRLTDEHNTAIASVVHLNKTKNAQGEKEIRGHLGTEFANKCSDVFVIAKNKPGGYSVVTQKLWRNDPWPEMELHLDKDEDGKTVYKIISGGEIKQREYDRLQELIKHISDEIKEAGTAPTVTNWANAVAEYLGVTGKTANNKYLTPARNIGLLREEKNPDKANSILLYLALERDFKDIQEDDDDL